MSIELTTAVTISLTAASVIIIPGLIAWISLREKVVRLEERVKSHEESNGRTDAKLDKIFDELKELRECLHHKND